MGAPAAQKATPRPIPTRYAVSVDGLISSAQTNDSAAYPYASLEAANNKVKEIQKTKADLEEAQRQALIRSRTVVNPTTLPQKIDNFRTVLAASEAKGFQNLSENEKKDIRAYADEVLIGKPKNFTEAVSNYATALAVARSKGIENLETRDRTDLATFARQVRDFDSETLGEGGKAILENISDVEDAINAVTNQRDLIARQKQRVSSLGGKEQEDARARLYTEEDALARIIATANQAAPRIDEALSRIGLTDILSGITTHDKRIAEVSGGLRELASDRVFGTGRLSSRLNAQITDDQILADINEARRNEFKSLYDIGTAAVTDLSSQLEAARNILPSVSPSQRAAAQKQISDLEARLTEARADTLQAQKLYEGYTPISGTQATTAISNFRETLRLPEERALDQIRQIDPGLFNTISGLSRQYGEFAAAPIGATISPETEALRRNVEQQIAGQVALGSQLGAEEQRQYQQAARAAQTARGNVFGVAPAVEEAVTTGLAGEQRLAARLGAAQGFLASGQTLSDAMARDVSLRNALQLSRLGAASEFAAGGPSLYGMGTQRAAQQQAALQQYTAAATPQQTGGFQAQPTQMTPYAYVNPQAGFLGAQNAANIYGSLADYQAQTYGDYTRAVASQPTFAQQFGQIAGGLSNLIRI